MNPSNSTTAISSSSSSGGGACEKALIKIIVLGCSNVGKTSIMERFATGKFTGNKIDVREQMAESERVDTNPILAWCRDNSYGHIETSAKDGNNIEAAMLAITALALESLRNKNRTGGGSGASSMGEGSQRGLKLDEKYSPKRSSCLSCS
eukprot:gene10269-11366_t